MITLGDADYQKAINEANELSLILRSGALPATISILEERQVGGSLGPELAREGILSTILGIAFVFVFMMFYYKTPGLISCITLTLNGLFLMALPAPWGWTAIVAPLAMLHFLLNVTGIPLTEKLSVQKRGDAYRAYQRTTSAFVPWLPKS